MIHQYEATKYVNIGRSHGRLCPNFFDPYVPFLTIVLIFLDRDHELTPCPMDAHHKTRV
jgi:hypothetical protein